MILNRLFNYLFRLGVVLVIAHPGRLLCPHAARYSSPPYSIRHPTRPTHLQLQPSFHAVSERKCVESAFMR
jgi:hypothetical protein